MIIVSELKKKKKEKKNLTTNQNYQTINVTAKIITTGTSKLWLSILNTMKRNCENYHIVVKNKRRNYNNNYFLVVRQTNLIRCSSIFTIWRSIFL